VNWSGHYGLLDNVVKESHYWITGTSGGNADRQNTLARAFAGRRVDGLVVVRRADLVREIVPVSFIRRGFGELAAVE